MLTLRSLRARVLLWVSICLIALFALTVAGLDVAFRQSTERSLRELLQAQLLGLIALAEPDAEQELTLPAEAVDPRLGVAESGVYGVLWDGEGRPIWQSLSLVARELDLGELPPPGEQRYVTVEQPGQPPLEGLLMGITWEFDDGHAAPYTFAIAVSLEPYQARQRAFRVTLIGWFTGITLTMLLVITALLRWVLMPLRTLERQVREVEAGERASLTGRYPVELAGLADDLNALIDTERRRQVRYQNTLDDLAHSLKTPLAVMRTLLSEHVLDQRSYKALNRELERMDQRVSHQLRRARASGATGIGLEPVAVKPLVKDLTDGLQKVYRDKRVVCEVDVASDTFFHGDSGDLVEVLGNLLDNAFKYCRQRVQLSVVARGGRLLIRIADDGAGISPDQLERLLERGGRADESVPGYGIGLAVVRETVALYHGELSFDRSPLGGAEVRVEIGRAGRSA